MKKLLLIGAVGVVGYIAYKQYKKKKGGCDCGCNSCHDTPAPAAPTSEIVPDSMREVFDTRPTSFFRPPARKPMVGSFAVKDSNELAYGAGTTEAMDTETAVAFVKH
jgi:hypothetical protein